MSRIQINGVTKRFGEVTALDGIELDIADGEFFCVLGPPGAGKTTLLRTIVGLEHPEAGRVLIGGTDVTDFVPSERNVSIVFQNLALYPDKTVYDNLAFPLRQGKEKVSSSEIDRRVKETAEVLQIVPLLKRRPAHLSGGERQRVAIGRCLVRAPLVYLLDEPLSALDALLRLQMRAELKYLQRDLGRTLVYVTHDQVEAMSMADRICVLDSGHVQQVGVPDDVYNRPINTFVATTVGMPPMNLVPVRVEAGNGSVQLRSSIFSFRAPLDSRLESITSQSGQELQIGVRPEDLRVGADAPGATMRCRVIAVEPLGGEVIVDLDLDGRIVKAMTPPDVHIEPDELIPVEFDLSRIHLFGTDGRSVYAADGASAFAPAA
jgi:multiple sugar transport system ATP-binding protein